MTQKQKHAKPDKQQRSKEHALPILASTTNFCEAATILGISTEQIYSWLREDPEFKAKLDALRAELATKAFSDAIEKLKSSMTVAVDTLLSLLHREDYPGVQRAAANDLINHYVKFKDTQELEERITKLEQMYRI
jgi:hypothetical protein